MENKYNILRAIVSIYRYIAYVIMFITLVYTVYNVAASANIYGRNFGLILISSGVTLLIGLAIALGMLAFSELITLFIDVETNTRKTSLILERMYKQRSASNRQQIDDLNFD